MVKRYDIWADGSDVAYIEVDDSEDGEWVKSEDYERLKDLAELLADYAHFYSALISSTHPDKSDKLRIRAEAVFELIE